jgi:hypothetical protein
MKKCKRPVLFLTSAREGYYTILQDAWFFHQSALLPTHSLHFHTDDLLSDGAIAPNDWVLYFPGATNPMIQ